MGVPELRARLTKWLSSDSRAVLFEQAGELVAYALCRDSDPCAEGKDAIYLRQFLVVASKRRQAHRPPSLRTADERHLGQGKKNFPGGPIKQPYRSSILALPGL